VPRQSSKPAASVSATPMPTEQGRSYKDLLIEKIQQLQLVHNDPFMSRKRVGSLLGVSDTALTEWIMRGRHPSQATIKIVASKFRQHGVPVSNGEFLRAAGYSEEDERVQQVYDTLLADTSLHPEEHADLKASVETVLDPNWRDRHPKTLEFIDTVLEWKNINLLEKARYMHSLVLAARPEEE
jgi:hypothetical protein